MLFIRVYSALRGGYLYVLLCLSIVHVFAVNVSAGEMRKWKAAEGVFQVEAALIQQSETHVKLKKKDGTELVVPREKLSKEDLDYLLFADPPLQKFAASGKPPAPKPATEPKPAADSKPITTQAKESPPKQPLKKPEASSLKGDTFESVRRSFNSSPDAQTNPEKLQPLPVSKGTNFEALVNELRKPIPVPTFVEQTRSTLELIAAGEKNWEATTWLCSAGTFLLEHDTLGKQLIVWNVETGKQACVWKCGETANARCLAISPTGKYLAVGRADQTVEVYDVTAKKVARTIKLDEQCGNVFRVTFNWEEKCVYVLTENADKLDFALDGGKDLVVSLHQYLPADIHTKQKPYKFDLKNDKIDFTISADGRLGVHLNGKLHLSFDPANNPRPHLYKTSMAYHPVVPVKRGVFGWVSKIAIHQKLYPQTPEGSKGPRHERGAHTFGEAKQFSLDRDERFAWACHSANGAWLVEIVSLDYVKRSLRVMLPNPGDAFSNEDRHWISAEQQRAVCWSPKTKQLTVYRVQDFVEPASWRLYGLVFQSVLEKRYEFLEGLFAELGKLDKPFHGSDGQLPLEEALHELSMKNLYVQEDVCHSLLESWIKERPKALSPRLVIGFQVLLQGSMARGAGTAGTVSPQGMQAFAQAGALADKLLDPVMSQAKPPAYAFSMQHTIAKMRSRSFEDQNNVADFLTKVYPTCWQFHSGMVYNLLPRWFGKQGDSVAYAEKIAKQLGGDTGDIAYGMMGSSLMKLHKAEDFVAATEFDPQRITRGLIKAALLTPEDARPFFRLLDWVLYTRYFDAKSDVLDPKMDEKLSKEYRVALAQFDRLVARNDWTLYEMPNEVAAEHAIFKSNSTEPPAKPKITILPIAG